MSFVRSQHIVSQSRNSPHFMEPEGSLPHSQVSVTCPYPEPDQSISLPQFHFLKIHLNIIPHLRVGLPSVLFPSGFTTKPLYESLPCCNIHFNIIKGSTSRSSYIVQQSPSGDADRRLTPVWLYDARALAVVFTRTSALLWAPLVQIPPFAEENERRLIAGRWARSKPAQWLAVDLRFSLSIVEPDSMVTDIVSCWQVCLSYKGLICE